MSDKLPTRKRIRLPEFDYDSHGMYFITVCTKDKACILSDITVGTVIDRPPDVVLTEYGRIVEEAILNIPAVYPSVQVEKYVIMPNHIHLLLFLSHDNGRPMVVPTVSRVVQQLKGFVSKRIGRPIWQKRFYDHVIRNYSDYRDIWTYIENNPARWSLDEYY